MNIARQGFVNMDNLFALHAFQSPLFRPWQLITHMIMHGSCEHIFFNMFALWMFGSLLETLWGPKRFLTCYIVCGLGAASSHLIVLYFQTQHLIEAFNSLDSATQDLYRNNFLAKLNEATIGASGAVFGNFAAFSYLFPKTRIYLYFFVPIKAKWFVIMYAAFELYLGIKNSAGDDVAHFAHLGGASVGIILVYFWNNNNRKMFY
jgi:membrane associated rhomboid family serine protease